ncbi:MAG: exosortase/archaeosortase family protein [Myxococcales bacterium]|nr:exosortase/archaeosortase family protein [Myxococcales bacterium]
MGLNVVLGVLAYRDLLTFRPYLNSDETLTIPSGEAVLFASSETAPLMIALLSLWLLYHRRVEFFALPRRTGPVWLAAIAFTVGGAIFAWAVYTRAHDLQALSLIANLVGCALLWRGFPALRIAAVPLLLLLFTMPPPAPLVASWIWSFQLATAVLAGWLLYLIEVPAVVSADVIQLTGDTYQVIESCSGLRSTLSLMIFSILMSNLFDRSRWHAVGLLLASIPIAFAMNGLRVLTLILNPASKIHTVHVAQGLVVLMCGLVLLYGVDGLLARLFPVRQQPRVAVGAANDRDEHAGISPLHRAVGVLCLLLLLLGTLNYMPRWRFRSAAGPQVELAFEQVMTGWESQKLETLESSFSTASFRYFHRMRYARPDAREQSALPQQVAADPPVDVFVGIGEHLNRFRSPLSPKNAFPGRGWVTEDLGEVHLDGSDAAITWKLLRSGTHRLIAYQWYEEDRGLLVEGVRSFFALDRSLLSRELPVIAIRIATQVDSTEPADIRQAHQRLTAFHSRVAVAVQSVKDRLRGSGDTEVSGTPKFPLWESYFLIDTESEKKFISKNKDLSINRTVA